MYIIRTQMYKKISFGPVGHDPLLAMVEWKTSSNSVCPIKQGQSPTEILLTIQARQEPDLALTVSARVNTPIIAVCFSL